MGPGLLVAALALAFLSSFIVVPAPVAWLLPIGVGAPEVSPWLALVSIVVGLASLVRVRVDAFARVAAALATLSALVAMSPLARLPATVIRFDRTMAAALGDDYLQGLPPEVVSGLRARPYSLIDFVRGLPPVPTSYTAVPGAAVIESLVKNDSKQLLMVVYRPSTPPRPNTLAPIVMQIYGGAWQRGEAVDDAEFARTLAAAGYVVCALEYRHAPAAQWPAQIEDVRHGMAWASERAYYYGGDATRVAIVGRSAGAQLALVAAYADRLPQVRAVVSYYGPIDLAEGWRQPPSPDPLGARPILETYLGGTPSQKPDAYREASPIAYVASSVPPTLLLYGARDHVVEARFARDLDRRLRAASATSVLLEIPWAEHAFDAIPNGVSGQLSLYYTERFLAWALHRNRP
jgi:acetyl esterase/lipase